VWQERTVSEMAAEILTHQAKALVYRTGQPLEEALVAILKTDSGRQLTELADGPHRHERARDWQAHAEHRAFLQQALEGVRASYAGEQ
jgi:hypothetical protein